MTHRILAALAFCTTLAGIYPSAARASAGPGASSAAPDPNAVILHDYVRDTVQSVYPGGGLPPYAIGDLTLFDALAAGLGSVAGLNPNTTWCAVSLDAWITCAGLGPLAGFSGGMGWPCDSFPVPYQAYAAVQTLAAVDLAPGRVARYVVFFPIAGGNGSVYAFRISLAGSHWTAESYCVAAPNSLGGGTGLLTYGTIGLGANDLSLLATPVPFQTTGAFMIGTAPSQAPLGNGFLCIGGSLLRLPPQKAIGNHLSYQLALPDPIAALLAAGGTWHLQAWYRDPAAGGAGFNLSNAVRLVTCP